MIVPAITLVVLISMAFAVDETIAALFNNPPAKTPLFIWNLMPAPLMAKLLMMLLPAESTPRLSVAGPVPGFTVTVGGVPTAPVTVKVYFVLAAAPMQVGRTQGPLDNGAVIATDFKE